MSNREASRKAIDVADQIQAKINSLKYYLSNLDYYRNEYTGDLDDAKSMLEQLVWDVKHNQ